MYGFLIVLHVVVCIGLITIVLIQTGKGTGLANVFGSGGGVQSVFGAQTGDVLTHTTAVLAVLFMVTSVSLAAISVRDSSSVMKTSRFTRTGATQQLPVTLPKSAQDIFQSIKDTTRQVADKIKGTIEGAAQKRTEPTMVEEKLGINVPVTESEVNINESLEETLTETPSGVPVNVEEVDIDLSDTPLRDAQ
ncbi:MAG: preprotein translocase subunit SecG [Candidatus Ancaeobacter aquaticus]|nr:preprotein translocase subunit SecG [Candidatus Ancaeobacter aquaticus]